MFGATKAHSECTLEDSYGSAGAGVERGFVFLVAASGESNHSPKLFFDQPFIPQLRDCQTRRRGIKSLPRQGHELVWIFLITEGESGKEPVVDVLPSHEAMLCTRVEPRNGPSVPVSVTSVQFACVLLPSST